MDVGEAHRLEHSSIAAHVVYQSVGGCIDAMSASCRARRTAIPREVCKESSHEPTGHAREAASDRHSRRRSTRGDPDVTERRSRSSATRERAHCHDVLGPAVLPTRTTSWQPGSSIVLPKRYETKTVNEHSHFQGSLRRWLVEGVQL